MARLLEILNLDTPLAGVNGGLFVTPELAVIERRTLPTEVAARSIELIHAHGLDPWVYRDNEWLIAKANAPHVAREAWTVQFEPKVVPDVGEQLDRIVKIVGVSDDHDRMQRCEADAQMAFGRRATASRSQPYYLDVTPSDAKIGSAPGRGKSVEGRVDIGGRLILKKQQNRI